MRAQTTNRPAGRLATRPTRRQEGVAMIFVVVMGMLLLMLTVVSLQSSLTQSIATTGEWQNFQVTQIRDSGSAQAIATIRESGMVAPVSGGGAAATWVGFGDGAFYYSTNYDPATGVSIIRSWGRMAIDSSPATNAASTGPDSGSWDGTGWLVRGSEVYVRGSRYIPDSPVYFGNGGIERPLGGFSWDPGVSATDPSTWSPILSSPSSYQASSVPFEVSAQDYPYNYLYSGGSPTPPTGMPHPYKIWDAQNAVGQYNIQAWFSNSAGYGNDPTIRVSPGPLNAYYDTSDPTSLDYPYPIKPDIPDVQDFAFALWNKYKSNASAPKLNGGDITGTYGDLASPKVTFVTGTLKVPEGGTFQGTGVLVIRDDYDPNTQTNNTPSTKAGLVVEGNFKWTGLVIVAGWAPGIQVSSDAGAQATIVGSLFGEDSVQSGGEVSLDSATITMTVQNPLRLYYSNALFRPGGLIYDFLPLTKKEIVGIKDL